MWISQKIEQPRTTKWHQLSVTGGAQVRCKCSLPFAILEAIYNEFGCFYEARHGSSLPISLDFLFGFWELLARRGPLGIWWWPFVDNIYRLDRWIYHVNMFVLLYIYKTTTVFTRRGKICVYHYNDAWNCKIHIVTPPKISLGVEECSNVATSLVKLIPLQVLERSFQRSLSQTELLLVPEILMKCKF